MGMDLSMLETPSYDEIPEHYPEILQDNPSYFRGVPTLLYDADVLDYTKKSMPRWPPWPPRGLSAKRAEKIRTLFSSQCDGEPVYSLENLKPSFRELRAMQRYLDAENRVLAGVSKRRGKVPAFKFSSNDGWHIIPEECLIIAFRLPVYLDIFESDLAVEAPRKRQSVMRLCMPTSEDIINPSCEQLLAAIDGLNHEDDQPYFTLEDHSRANAFIQTFKDSARLFCVEYAEQEPQRQFSTSRISKGKVKEMFLAYLDRDKSFKALASWKEITEELFGEARQEQQWWRDQIEWARNFAAYNELAARYGGYRVW